MIAECHEVLADAALISLDYGLNKETPGWPDPGDRVDVASFLARFALPLPVILQTSNTDRIWSRVLDDLPRAARTSARLPWAIFFRAFSRCS